MAASSSVNFARSCARQATSPTANQAQSDQLLIWPPAFQCAAYTLRTGPATGCDVDRRPDCLQGRLTQREFAGTRSSSYNRFGFVVVPASHPPPFASCPEEPA